MSVFNEDLLKSSLNVNIDDWSIIGIVRQCKYCLTVQQINATHNFPNPAKIFLIENHLNECPKFNLNGRIWEIQ